MVGCITAAANKGKAIASFKVKENGLIHFIAKEKIITEDYGYDYQWYVEHA